MDEFCESSQELETEIRHRIEESGGISFRDYMALCLYHPQHGYYMAPRQRIGKEGDFFTSSSVHSLFGRLVARQLKQMWELLDRGDFVIVEQGAGEGHLCLDILDAIAEEAPDFYKSLRYVLVEISPDNRDRQAALLAHHRERVEWRSMEELAGIRGCFLSNELVDAFPVHLVEKRNGELREVFVTWRDGHFVEDLRAPAAEIAEHLARLGVGPVEGNRAEINLEAVRWMRQVATLLDRGFVLTIDYGYPAAELFAPFRRGGTLMCYSRHTTSEDPYQRVGCQDMTAHVDFTSLQQVGSLEGLETLWFGEQYRFLLGLGFLEMILSLQARETDENRARTLRMVAKNLILPEGGMGETFKVLVQGKQVGRPALACGRPIRDIPMP